MKGSKKMVMAINDKCDGTVSLARPRRWGGGRTFGADSLFTANPIFGDERTSLPAPRDLAHKIYTSPYQALQTFAVAFLGRC